MAKLDDLKAELLAAQVSITPQIEGLHDFARLNLTPDTLAVVNTGISDFERRLGLIVAALKALEDLIDDNYPAVDVRLVPKAVFADLQDNVSTIEAAFAKFKGAEEAVSGKITAGVPRPIVTA